MQEEDGLKEADFLHKADPFLSLSEQRLCSYSSFLPAGEEVHYLLLALITIIRPSESFQHL